MQVYLSWWWVMKHLLMLSLNWKLKTIRLFDSKLPTICHNWFVVVSYILVLRFTKAKRILRYDITMTSGFFLYIYIYIPCVRKVPPPSTIWFFINGNSEIFFGESLYSERRSFLNIKIINPFYQHGEVCNVVKTTFVCSLAIKIRWVTMLLLYCWVKIETSSFSPLFLFLNRPLK